MLNPGILLKFPLQNLNRMGLLRTEKSSRAVFLITHMLVLLFGLVIVLLLMQYFYMNDDVTSYVNNFEGVVVFVQGTVKWCLCLYNKQTFLNLITLSKKFWTDDQCSRTTQKGNQLITKRILLLQKVLTASFVFIFCVATLYSIIQKKLILGDWQIENNGMLFKLAWITSFISGGIFVLFVGFHDCLYLGFCVEVKMQCSILYSHLEQLSVKTINCKSQFQNYYQNLQTYIEHHILLLRFHDELQKAYSVLLMFQYLTTVPLLCGDMYALTETSDSYLMIRYTASTCSIILQIGFYCIPANYVEHEMSTIATAIYNSDWYSKHFPMLRTPIILMIQIAQQKKSLTACGLIEINIETFLNLLQLTVSICMALKKFKISD